jgi:hypothetical protein
VITLQLSSVRVFTIREVKLTAVRGRIVQTPGERKPYKVILEHDGGPDTEHEVDTMREGEALIRERTPSPPRRDGLRDHSASEA